MGQPRAPAAAEGGPVAGGNQQVFPPATRHQTPRLFLYKLQRLSSTESTYKQA